MSEVELTIFIVDRMKGGGTPPIPCTRSGNIPQHERPLSKSLRPSRFDSVDEIYTVIDSIPESWKTDLVSEDISGEYAPFENADGGSFHMHKMTTYIHIYIMANMELCIGALDYGIDNAFH